MLVCDNISNDDDDEDGRGKHGVQRRRFVVGFVLRTVVVVVVVVLVETIVQNVTDLSEISVCP